MEFTALAYLSVLLNLVPLLELDGYWFLADALDRMEKGRGEPYPPRQSQLRGGRPVGTGKGK